MLKPRADLPGYPLDDQGRVLGLDRGIPLVQRVWELHPLVVAAECREASLGTRLVRTWRNKCACERITLLYAASDDEMGQPPPAMWTSMRIYPAALKTFRTSRGHPSTKSLQTLISDHRCNHRYQWI